MFFPRIGALILSTEPGDKYGYRSGTSMAAPLTAGAAACVLAELGREDGIMSGRGEQIKELLMQTVDKVDVLKGVCKSEGRLNLLKVSYRLGAPKKLL